MLYKDEAIVLRTMRLGEADRIVTFLGRSNGKIRAVAKGVRKTKSRFGGRLEPFNRVSLVLWRSRSSLDIVTQVEVLDHYRALREDLDRFGLGEVMLEAADRLVQERERSYALYQLLSEGLAALVAGREPLILASFLLRLAGLAGFAPVLNACAECGGRPAAFDPDAGGAVCELHRTPASLDASQATLRLMFDLASEGAWMEQTPPVTAEALSLSRLYAEHHLERRLRAADTAEEINLRLQPPGS